MVEPVDSQMKKRACKVLLILLAVTGCIMWLARATTRAQQAPGAQEAQKSVPAGQAAVRDQSGRVSVKLTRGGKVAVGNRSTGRITIVGWDRDTIEATATSERGQEAVRFGIAADSSGTRILLKADYAGSEGIELQPEELNVLEDPVTKKGREAEAKARQEAAKLRLKAAKAVREERRKISKGRQKADRQEVEINPSELSSTPPEAQTTPKAPKAPSLPKAPTGASSYPAPKPPPIIRKPPAPPPPIGHRAEINLVVKLPRYAEIDIIKVSRSDVEVTGIDTPVTVNSDRSSIKLSRVGAAEVRTRSGKVEVDNAGGLVDVITTSGAITVRHAGSDVRALSLRGRIEIRCAQGRVDVSNTEGAIILAGISGDVDATTTSSEVDFTGGIREDGRYHLKSMSGPVEMSLRANSPGFTAALSSYRGGVETNFSLKTQQLSHTSPVNRRMIGRYGNGRAQITLDSFDGTVKLTKVITGAEKDCK